MTLDGFGSVCAKLELASSKNNELLVINVLQKFTSHALYVTCETLITRFFWQFLLLKNGLLRKFEKRFCVKHTHTHTHAHTKTLFPLGKSICESSLTGEFCKPETNCLCGSHRQHWSECFFHLSTFSRQNSSFKPNHSMAD